jgi:hypothetical protein
LELQAYQMILSGKVTKRELEEDYTLDDFLKLQALYRMERDIESADANRPRKETEQNDNA